MKRPRFGVLKDWCVPGKGTECLPAVATTLWSLSNAETGAPGYFGLFGWHVPSSGLLKSICCAVCLCIPHLCLLVFFKDEIVLVLPAQSPSQLDFKLCQ